MFARWLCDETWTFLIPHCWSWKYELSPCEKAIEFLRQSVLQALFRMSKRDVCVFRQRHGNRRACIKPDSHFASAQPDWTPWSLRKSWHFNTFYHSGIMIRNGNASPKPQGPLPKHTVSQAIVSRMGPLSHKDHSSGACVNRGPIWWFWKDLRISRIHKSPTRLTVHLGLLSQVRRSFIIFAHASILEVTGVGVVAVGVQK